MVNITPASQQIELEKLRLLEQPENARLTLDAYATVSLALMD